MSQKITSNAAQSAAANSSTAELLKALQEASKTIDYISSIKILEQRANINSDKISQYFVDLDLSFVIDRDRD